MKFASLAGSEKLTSYAISISAFLELFNISSLSSILLTIQSYFSSDFASIRVLIISYSIAVSVLIPITAWISYLLGLRNTFISAAGMFFTGSIACFLSPNLTMLVAGRVMQGVGCAFLVPIGRIFIAHRYQGPRLLKAMSGIAIPALLGAASGPLISGFLADIFGWRSVFVLGILFGALLLFMAVVGFEDDFQREKRKMDLVGWVLVSGIVVSLLISLSQFRRQISADESSGLSNALLIVFLVLFTLYLTSGRQYLLNFNLLQITSFRIASFYGGVSRLGTSGVPLLAAYGLQIGYSYSLPAIGFFLFLQALGAIASKSMVSRIVSSYGYKKVLVFNSLILALLVLFVGRSIGDGGTFLISSSLFVYGISSSLQFSCLNTLIYLDLPSAERASGTCLGGTLMQLSVSSGIALAFATSNFINVLQDTSLFSSVCKAFYLLSFLVAVSSIGYLGLSRSTTT